MTALRSCTCIQLVSLEACSRSSSVLSFPSRPSRGLDSREQIDLKLRNAGLLKNDRTKSISRRLLRVTGKGPKGLHETHLKVFWRGPRPDILQNLEVEADKSSEVASEETPILQKVRDVVASESAVESPVRVHNAARKVAQNLAPGQVGRSKEDTARDRESYKMLAKDDDERGFSEEIPLLEKAHHLASKSWEGLEPDTESLDGDKNGSKEETRPVLQQAQHLPSAAQGVREDMKDPEKIYRRAWRNTRTMLWWAETRSTNKAKLLTEIIRFEPSIVTNIAWKETIFNLLH